MRDRLDTITILKDFRKYKKFDKLGNFNLTTTGLRQTYRVADDIIKDIDNEIENDEHLKQTRDAINFMTDVATGNVQLEKYEKENKTEE